MKEPTDELDVVVDERDVAEPGSGRDTRVEGQATVLVEGRRSEVAMDFIMKEYADCVNHVEGNVSAQCHVVESSTQQLRPERILRVPANHDSIWTDRLRTSVYEVGALPESGWRALFRIYPKALEDESNNSPRTGVRRLDVIAEFSHWLSSAHVRPF